MCYNDLILVDFLFERVNRVKYRGFLDISIG